MTISGIRALLVTMVVGTILWVLLIYKVVTA